MVGVLAVILGIVGFKQSSRLNRGKFAAIIGIFFGVGGPFQIITEFPNLVLMSHLYKVKYDFKQISSMLEQYRANGGIFPSTMQGLRVLITEPSGSPRPKSWKQISAVLPKDPWGNEYSYRFPGKRYVNTFEIMSNGPDGRSYTPDDISSQDLSQ